MSRVYLHVGAPKTGTTFLQGVLWENRETLAGQGVLYGGRDAAEHFYAAQDLRGRYFRGHPHPRVPGAWARLAAQARGWSGPTVLISHEILAGCDPDEARRAVESLHPHEVHVVLTARDLARQIPAMWQESVKNGRRMPYARYLRTLQQDEPALVGRIFWRTQDVLDVLRRWGAAVPAERIHVVTVPAPGSEAGLLWQRFCVATGIDPAGVDTSAAPHGNASLGHAESEVLRLLNVRLKDRLSWPDHEAVVKRFLARDVLGARGATSPIGLPSQERAWVRERALATVQGVSEGGYDVVGSLDDLVPGEHGPDHATSPVDADVAAATVDTLAAVLSQQVGPRGGSSRVARARRRAGALLHRLRRR